MRRDQGRGLKSPTGEFIPREYRGIVVDAFWAFLMICAVASSSSVRVVGGARKISPRALRSRTAAGPRPEAHGGLVLVVPAHLARRAARAGRSARRSGATRPPGVIQRAQGTSASSASRSPRARERRGEPARRAAASCDRLRRRARSTPGVADAGGSSGTMRALLQRLAAGGHGERARGVRGPLDAAHLGAARVAARSRARAHASARVAPGRPCRPGRPPRRRGSPTSGCRSTQKTSIPGRRRPASPRRWRRGGVRPALGSDRNSAI